MADLLAIGVAAVSKAPVIAQAAALVCGIIRSSSIKTQRLARLTQPNAADSGDGLVIGGRLPKDSRLAEHPGGEHARQRQGQGERLALLSVTIGKGIH